MKLIAKEKGLPKCTSCKNYGLRWYHTEPQSNGSISHLHGKDEDSIENNYLRCFLCQAEYTTTEIEKEIKKNKICMVCDTHRNIVETKNRNLLCQSCYDEFLNSKFTESQWLNIKWNKL